MMKQRLIGVIVALIMVMAVPVAADQGPHDSSRIDNLDVIMEPPFNFAYLEWTPDAQSPAEWYNVQVKRGASVVYDNWYAADEFVGDEFGFDHACDFSDCVVTVDFSNTIVANDVYTFSVRGWRLTSGLEQPFNVNMPVQVAAPQTVALEIAPDSGRPVLYFDALGTASWLHLYVGGNGYQFNEWLPLSTICAELFQNTCAYALPIDFPPGTYQVWAESYGPGGMSINGVDAPDFPSWYRFADYVVGGLPADPPSELNVAPSGGAAHIRWAPGLSGSWFNVKIIVNSNTIFDEWINKYDARCLQPFSEDPEQCQIYVEETIYDMFSNRNATITVQAWAPGGFSNVAETLWEGAF